MSGGVFFYISTKVVKDFNSKIKGTFWKYVKFAVTVYKSEINLVLILWISEIHSYKSQFLHQIIKGKKYIVIFAVIFLNPCIKTTEISIFGIHNYSNHIFWFLKILELYAELPQKIIPYDRMEWKYEK
jgi:hypothetical protein